MSNFELERLKSSEMFKKLASPVSVETVARDAEFFIRNDGLVVNAEGWYHPPKLLIGEVLYVPDQEGDKEIFGERYRKITLFPGTYTPVTYSERASVLSRIDPFLDQTKTNPFFARYKQIFPLSELIAHLPSKQVLSKILDEFATPSDEIMLDLKNLEALLGIDLSRMSIGLTGGALLGNFRGYHDLDLVFQGSVEENIELAKGVRDLVIHEKERRVVEGGKGWNIRFLNDRGVIMCTFFGYSNPQEAPLVNFAMEIVEENVTVEGSVADDRHSVYTPTVLGMEDIFFTQIGGKNLRRRGPPMPLIIYHTATRGECFSGDRIRAQGAWVEVVTPQHTYEAICAIKREAVRNLTPSWEGYYEK
jgi:predicted nucleotidyltransferase